MAKAKAETAQLDLRNLSAQILVGALPRIAHVLKPYPKGAKGSDITAAVEQLAEAGLVHAGGKSPNLTQAGVELARNLAAKKD